jgi:hypothetical protein
MRHSGERLQATVSLEYYTYLLTLAVANISH